VSRRHKPHPGQGELFAAACWVETSIKERGQVRNAWGMVELGRHPTLREGRAALDALRARHPNALAVLRADDGCPED
jgi:hypothetical protein